MLTTQKYRPHIHADGHRLFFRERLMATIPTGVLEAFDCIGTPKRLPGGQETSFIVGDVVLKPIDNIARYTWASELLLRMPQAGFRISTPLKSRQNQFTYAGWSAAIYEPGAEIMGRWEDKLDVCRAFHIAMPDRIKLPMPPSDDRWTYAHKIVWGDGGMPQNIHPEIRRLIMPLFKHYPTMAPPDQIIHSDMCGNILFDDELGPLVIDFSPAYGPPAYAEAIIVVDAIAWEDAPMALIHALPDTSDYRQMLIRAVNFRLIVAALFYSEDVARFRRAYDDFVPLLQWIE